MNLKSRITKKNTGEKIKLKTFEDLWVIPKKYSVIQEDELNSMQQELIAENPKILKIATEMQKEDQNFESFFDNADVDEIKALFAMSGAGIDYMRKTLLYGISKNNLCDDEDKGIKETESLSEEIIEIILGDKDLTTELVQIVNNFNNVDLTKKTSEIVSPGV